MFKLQVLNGDKLNIDYIKYYSLQLFADCTPRKYCVWVYEIEISFTDRMVLNYVIWHFKMNDYSVLS